ncbi:hypothetical protein HNY73_002198 [Argiope bruennichi]|uniref:Uncharacterized protein n=1 Tax=Argiope bruennichi TaxID=94029 RepID=A0A8T0FTV0_ARGBR|nr:hypothetical protein HNY73_002198 [Argiope bruennichi]
MACLTQWHHYTVADGFGLSRRSFELELSSKTWEQGSRSLSTHPSTKKKTPPGHLPVQNTASLEEKLQGMLGGGQRSAPPPYLKVFIIHSWRHTLRADPYLEQLSASLVVEPSPAPLSLQSEDDEDAGLLELLPCRSLSFRREGIGSCASSIMAKMKLVFFFYGVVRDKEVIRNVNNGIESEVRSVSETMGT